MTTRWRSVELLGVVGGVVLGGLAEGVAVGASGTVDLTVASVELTQAVWFSSSKLIGGNPVTARVKVWVAGSAEPVANVDARMRVYANGVEIPGSPFFSTNGPFTAPLAPQMSSLEQTLNFSFIPPVSNDVDVVVELNPAKLALESSYANNTFQLSNKVFECRKTMELVYEPIDYVPGGGQPSASLIEPGIGDAFVLAIYSLDWNYHRSPLPPLKWTQNVNSSNSQLLNTLHDIRTNQIPAAGYPKPDFVYGWLPGNPFSGNGQAISIGGDVAFGNTQTNKHQRTFAHELGHLWGLQHNSNTIKTNGIDEEHHLKDTENLAPIFGTSKKDVMVAGQMTKDAFVNSSTYNKALADVRTKCASVVGDPPGGGGDLSDAEILLRVSGVMTHAPQRSALFNPVLQIDVDEATPHDAQGDLEIRSFAADGALLTSIRVRTDSLRAMCVHEPQGRATLLAETPFYALIPAAVEGTSVHRIELIDVLSGAALAQRERSARAPQVSDLVVTSNAIDPATGLLGGEVTVTWTAADDDGDTLQHVLFYSRDAGDSWLPIGVNLEETTFAFSASDIPASKPGQGVFRVRTTDGFNVTDAATTQALTLDSSMAATLAMGGVAGEAIGNPPDVHLVSPNSGKIFAERASVILRAAAWDLEDELLDGDSVVWTSSLDGAIATGRWALTQALSVGTHEITVSGTDADGQSTSKTIQVVISPRTLTNPDLNGDGLVDATDLGLLLVGWHDDAPVAPGVGTSDLNLDGLVDEADLGELLAAWSE
jgi:hypothetical protein